LERLRAVCSGYSSECAIKDCKVLADCRWDPFCKVHRAFMYDDPDPGIGRPKYEPGSFTNWDEVDG
jgi:hypothetical protein